MSSAYSWGARAELGGPSPVGRAPGVPQGRSKSWIGIAAAGYNLAMGSPSRTSSPAAAALSGLEGIRAWVEDFYRDLHEHPELSHQEVVTAAKVAGRLAASGVSVHTGVAGTGVVGLLRNGGGARRASEGGHGRPAGG